MEVSNHLQVFSAAATEKVLEDSRYWRTQLKRKEHGYPQDTPEERCSAQSLRTLIMPKRKPQTIQRQKIFIRDLILRRVHKIFC